MIQHILILVNMQTGAAGARSWAAGWGWIQPPDWVCCWQSHGPHIKCICTAVCSPGSRGPWYKNYSGATTTDLIHLWSQLHSGMLAVQPREGEERSRAQATDSWLSWVQESGHKLNCWLFSWKVCVCPMKSRFVTVIIKDNLHPPSPSLINH